ncbi:MAG: primosomal protein N' [Betaproteobacteria bacterium AqS2]|uniref:Probable replication restart protein PriA n=1 Tax=Candidatus Amphirhobacter heronislandensis TaxID=1732024 RepID=A0A930UF67_9GAMM|nr:primosomal protein N' [Betaproteobacteria bacterium AqS2]
MILKVAFDLPSGGPYDYFGVEGAALPPPGTRVLAKLGNAQRVGVVVAVTGSSEVPLMKLRGIDAVLDGGEPLVPADIVALLVQTAQANFLPLGKLVFGAIPPQARKAAKDLDFGKAAAAPVPQVPAPQLGTLPAAQQQLLRDLAKDDGGFAAHVVAGLPGSGKRELCATAVEATLARGRSCLLLAPDIAAAEEWHARLRERLPQVPGGVVHSGLTPAKRLAAWLQARAGGWRLAVATRAGVWTPLPDLGLVCVVKENSELYRSETRPVFSARDVAARRARLAGCPALLSAAAPSLELRNAAQRRQVRLLQLPPGEELRPKVSVVDISQRTLFGGLSMELENALRQQIKEGGLSAVLVHRRGRGGMIYCPECRHLLRCPQCRSPLALDDSEHCQCRRCGRRQQEPSSCPGCGGGRLASIRPGSTRVAASIQARIPEARVLKVDGDSDPAEIQRRLAQGVDVVVGTKLLFGLKLQPLTCGVPDADAILLSPNLRAAEELMETLTSIIAASPAVKLVIQTRFAQHHAYKALASGSYDDFAFPELREREDAGLPPFRRLALFAVTGKDAETVSRAAGAAHYHAAQLRSPGVSLMEIVIVPQPQGTRMQFLQSAARRGDLHAHLRALEERLRQHPLPKQAEWEIEIDPLVC